MLVQRFEPQGRLFTNFHYYYIINNNKKKKKLTSKKRKKEKKEKLTAVNNQTRHGSDSCVKCCYRYVAPQDGRAVVHCRGGVAVLPGTGPVGGQAANGADRF